MENKWVFDRLFEQREAVEADFGAPLEWLRLDDKKASRISYRKAYDGYDPENWPEMIEWLVDHVKRLERAFGGRLKDLKPKLRAALDSTAEPQS